MALNCCPRHVGISKQMISQGKFRWRATVYSMSDVLHGANRDSNFYPHYKNSILYKKILQQKQPSFEICKNLHESNSSGFLFHQQLTISSWLGKEAQMRPKAACITQSPLLPNAGISKSYISHLQTIISVHLRMPPPSPRHSFTIALVDQICQGYWIPVHCPRPKPNLVLDCFTHSTAQSLTLTFICKWFPIFLGL